MSESIDLSVDFAGLNPVNPVFTASGTCGYCDELSDFMDLSRLGGFVTKSITPEPRKGNLTPRIVETDSGMLNAIGLANVGLDQFIEEKLPVIAEMKTLVFVNLAGRTMEDYVAVTEKLADREEIAGFELNISCPNVKKGGITFGTDPIQVEQITSAVKVAAQNKILMVKLTPNVTEITETARAAVYGGANALSLVNTFTAMVIDIETRRPILANRSGGLSGPAIKPIAVYLVHRVFTEVAKPNHIPIMGMGGIRTASDALEFILAGATAIAVGTATFSQPDCALRIIHGLEEFCRRKGIHHIRELIGGLQ
ncbi:MAG: dihydroorotate dehydrogenase [Sedimentisphaerales bacterium]|nr:dihydroorotate dehydrogenase [Sedimentisphaerales bacterium]